MLVKWIQKTEKRTKLGTLDKVVRRLRKKNRYSSNKKLKFNSRLLN